MWQSVHFRADLANGNQRRWKLKGNHQASLGLEVLYLVWEESGQWICRSWPNVIVLKHIDLRSQLPPGPLIQIARNSGFFLDSIRTFCCWRKPTKPTNAGLSGLTRYVQHWTSKEDALKATYHVSVKGHWKHTPLGIVSCCTTLPITYGNRPHVISVDTFGQTR